MKYIVAILGFILIISCSSVQSQSDGGDPISHQLFDNLLKKHVDPNGLVDYKGFQKDRDELRKYLDLLQSTSPGDNWSDEEQMAYWINVYNAFTIDLILEHYPLKSIKDIGSSIQIPFVNTPWDIKFIEIGGEIYDLNNVEHGILRKRWEEPRIHFAINCASNSCPVIRSEAYTAQKLEGQLEDQASKFINDDSKNDITASEAKLSKIFDWYGGDFKNEMPLRDFINQYADVKITNATKVSFKEYDWRLNEKQ